MRVKRTFARYSKVAPHNGMSGRAGGGRRPAARPACPDLQIRAVAGQLTDHYDPRNRTLNLSPDVGEATSLAALGVAAHEAGHAIQDARGYHADADPPDARPGGHVRPVALDPAGRSSA